MARPSLPRARQHASLLGPTRATQPLDRAEDYAFRCGRPVSPSFGAVFLLCSRSTPGRGSTRWHTTEGGAINEQEDGIKIGPPNDSADEPVPGLLIDLLTASQHLDSAAIGLALTAAAATLGVGAAIDDVVLPAMRQIGNWWAAGSYTIAQEQLTTEAIRSWLDRLSSAAGPPRRLPPVLLACGPRDRHTIGAEALATLLRRQGRHCRVLGSRISPDRLMFATIAAEPAAVVIVSHLDANRRYALDAVDRINNAGITVFYAGNAFADPDIRAGLPGIYLGTNLQDACSQVCAVLEGAAELRSGASTST